MENPERNPLLPTFTMNDIAIIAGTAGIEKIRLAIRGGRLPEPIRDLVTNRIDANEAWQMVLRIRAMPSHREPRVREGVPT